MGYVGRVLHGVLHTRCRDLWVCWLRLPCPACMHACFMHQLLFGKARLHLMVLGARSLLLLSFTVFPQAMGQKNDSMIREANRARR